MSSLKASTVEEGEGAEGSCVEALFVGVDSLTCSSFLSLTPFSRSKRNDTTSNPMK